MLERRLGEVEGVCDHRWISRLLVHGLDNDEARLKKEKVKKANLSSLHMQPNASLQ